MTPLKEDFLNSKRDSIEPYPLPDIPLISPHPLCIYLYSYAPYDMIEVLEGSVCVLSGRLHPIVSQYRCPK
jgi:hypothetical protein